jgi:hypothetical protein
MTGQQNPSEGTGLAQARAEYPGWLCWVALTGTCYALHLAALRAGPPPPPGEIYALQASDPASLLSQLRATPRHHPNPPARPGTSPGDQAAPGAATAGLVPVPPGPPDLTDTLRAISDLTTQAAWLREYGDPGQRQDAGVLPVSTYELCALGQLAALGAELNQRGYLAHLTMTPPVFLTIGHPQARRPQRVYAAGEFLCWGQDRLPLCERWTSTAAEAAGEVAVLTRLGHRL